MKTKDDDLIVAVDIGSDKIIVVISEVDDNGNISVIGIGQTESKSGVRQGVVINIESVVSALTDAIETAEIQAGREISSVYVGISGSNITSQNSRGIVAISGPDKEIREMDIERVIDAAKAIPIPLDREILHILTQNFTVDGQDNIRIKYPIGIVGTRLECQIHIVTTAISSIQNIVKCLNRSGLEVKDIVLQNIASSKAVLLGDETELGVLVIDIGAETSNVSVYQHQAPYFSAIYPLGGYLVTNDLAAGLEVSFSTAEKIKTTYGVADINYVEKNEMIQIPSVGGRIPRTFARANLIHIIKPRLEEIFSIIKNDLDENGFLDKITGGIVLTGGASLLPGTAEVCQEVFLKQTRIGYPKKLNGFGDNLYSPEYATVNGLLLWAHEKFYNEGDFVRKNRKDEKKNGKIFKVIKNIFEDFF